MIVGVILSEVNSSDSQTLCRKLTDFPEEVGFPDDAPVFYRKLVPKETSVLHYQSVLRKNQNEHRHIWQSMSTKKHTMMKTYYAMAWFYNNMAYSVNSDRARTAQQAFRFKNSFPNERLFRLVYFVPSCAAYNEESVINM